MQWRSILVEIISLLGSLQLGEMQLWCVNFAIFSSISSQKFNNNMFDNIDEIKNIID